MTGIAHGSADGPKKIFGKENVNWAGPKAAKPMGVDVGSRGAAAEDFGGVQEIDDNWVDDVGEHHADQLEEALEGIITLVDRGNLELRSMDGQITYNTTDELEGEVVNQVYAELKDMAQSGDVSDAHNVLDQVAERYTVTFDPQYDDSDPAEKQLSEESLAYFGDSLDKSSSPAVVNIPLNEFIDDDQLREDTISAIEEYSTSRRLYTDDQYDARWQSISKEHIAYSENYDQAVDQVAENYVNQALDAHEDLASQIQDTDAATKSVANMFKSSYFSADSLAKGSAESALAGESLYDTGHTSNEVVQTMVDSREEELSLELPVEVAWQLNHHIAFEQG